MDGPLVRGSCFDDGRGWDGVRGRPRNRSSRPDQFLGNRILNARPRGPARVAPLAEDLGGKELWSGHASWPDGGAPPSWPLSLGSLPLRRPQRAPPTWGPGPPPKTPLAVQCFSGPRPATTPHRSARIPPVPT